jgi:hypothetical protein
MNTIKIIDVSTNEVIEREMNKKEYDDIASRKSIVANEKAEAEAKAEAKAAAEAKLVALGLDLDDLRALGL